MYSKWIQSYRDLPILINQWANVVRWEMRPRLFLRTTEFLWQEGHTAHATEAEAREETLRMLDIYERLCVEYLAVPVLKGIKSDAERFAGAQSTYAVEALMQDGKALQMATSHNLGQNFAKAFDIQFQAADGKRKFAWTTSWGLSTRTVGAVVMVHGDDDGLVLPPKIAPIQAVIVPIFRNDEEKSKVLAEAARVKAALADAGLKVRLDDREQLKPGPKFFEWEKKGVPVRLELGPRDVDQKQTVVVRRDDRSKEPVALDAVVETVTKLMDEIQTGLYDRAKARMDSHTHRADTMEEFEALLDEPGGFVSAHWDGTGKTEEAIKELTKATIRVMPFDDEREPGKCIVTGEPSARRVLFARAY
jgi:prolyl-tRNA synthetase